MFIYLWSVRKIRLHHGLILAAAVEATGLNKETVAVKAGYSRSGYYKHIKKSDLGFHILIAYGKAIKHDFTEELPNMPKYIVEDLPEPYSKTISAEEAIRQRDIWRDRYFELMVKYNKLIEEKIDKKK